jgi:hypothetical protein
MTPSSERGDTMKPICKLTGVDGNVFAIIGAVSQAKRAKQPEKVGNQ